MCQELLGEATVQKVAHFPLLARTKARQIGKIAEDTEAQLLERINESPWYTIQGPSLLMLTKRQQWWICVIYFSKGCAWGYVIYTFVVNQYHSCRTIPVFEWLRIRKIELVILCQCIHGWNSCSDWPAVWFHYSGQRCYFWMWVYA